MVMLMHSIFIGGINWYNKGENIRDLTPSKGASKDGINWCNKGVNIEDLAPS